jgi:hypothetical protein
MADFLALTREVAPSARPGRAVTTVTTTGYGDINLVDAADGIKLFGMGLMLLRTVPLGSRALAVADLPGAALAGRTIDEAEAALELGVLARDEAWWPPGSERIDPQSRVLVLASREGLAAVHFGAG